MDWSPRVNVTASEVSLNSSVLSRWKDTGRFMFRISEVFEFVTSFLKFLKKAIIWGNIVGLYVYTHTYNRKEIILSEGILPVVNVNYSQNNHLLKYQAVNKGL